PRPQPLEGVGDTDAAVHKLGDHLRGLLRTAGCPERIEGGVHGCGPAYRRNGRDGRRHKNDHDDERNANRELPHSRGDYSPEAPHGAARAPLNGAMRTRAGAPVSRRPAGYAFGRIRRATTTTARAAKSSAP